MPSAHGPAPEQRPPYIVLGLLEQRRAGDALRPQAAGGAEHEQLLDGAPHAALHRVRAACAEVGLLEEEREQTGRRRRIYRLTEAGSRRSTRWRRIRAARASVRAPRCGDAETVLRCRPGDARRAAQVEAHSGGWTDTRRCGRAGRGHARGLARWRSRHGIGHEREFIHFWRGWPAGASEPCCGQRAGLAPASGRSPG